MAPFGKGSKHTLETRERQSRVRLKQEATKREARRQAAEAAARAEIAAPPELRAYRERGVVAPSLEQHVEHAAHESAALIAELGGEEHVTAQRRVLVQDVARMRVLLGALMGRFLSKPAPALVGQITSLVNSRRSSLVALGLGRLERELDPLAEYESAFRQVPAATDEDGEGS